MTNTSNLVRVSYSWASNPWLRTTVVDGGSPTGGPPPTPDPSSLSLSQSLACRAALSPLSLPLLRGVCGDDTPHQYSD
jgi:hypothetical protein